MQQKRFAPLVMFAVLPLATLAPACGDAINNSYYTVVCDGGTPVVIPNVPEAGADSGHPLYCYAACSRDRDCSYYELCSNGRCRTNTNYYVTNAYSKCESDHVAVNSRGDRRDCYPFNCYSGRCETTCNNSTWCAPGAVCNTGLTPRSCVVAQSPNTPGATEQTPTTPRHENGCVRKCSGKDGLATAECEDNEMCYHGECMLRVPVCTDATHSTADGAEIDDCGKYRCNALLGTCLSECTADQDCAGGYVCCASQRRCVPTSEINNCPL